MRGMDGKSSLLPRPHLHRVLLYAENTQLTRVGDDSTYTLVSCRSSNIKGVNLLFSDQDSEFTLKLPADDIELPFSDRSVSVSVKSKESTAANDKELSDMSKKVASVECVASLSDSLCISGGASARWKCENSIANVCPGIFLKECIESAIRSRHRGDGSHYSSVETSSIAPDKREG